VLGRCAALPDSEHARSHNDALHPHPSRLKPGSFKQFRAAWGRGRDAVPKALRRERVYHARSIQDENEIVSFHLTKLSLSELAHLRSEISAAEEQQETAMAEFVEWTGVSDVFEIIEEIRLGG